jgi:hypothetical protein
MAVKNISQIFFSDSSRLIKIKAIVEIQLRKLQQRLSERFAAEYKR